MGDWNVCTMVGNLKEMANVSRFLRFLFTDFAQKHLEILYSLTVLVLVFCFCF